MAFPKFDGKDSVQGYSAKPDEAKPLALAGCGRTERAKAMSQWLLQLTALSASRCSVGTL